MIKNLSYYDKEINEEINDLLGERYNLFNKIKMNGIGSRRMIIENFSPEFIFVKSDFNDIQYANIELRPKGILVHITKGIQNFGWAIPFYKLSIFHTSFFSIHSEGAYLNLNKSKSVNENKDFIRKLMHLKLIATT